MSIHIPNTLPLTLIATAVWLCACGTTRLESPPTAPVSPDAHQETTADSSLSAPHSPAPAKAAPAPPEGTLDDPIPMVLEEGRYRDQRDSSQGTDNVADVYGCTPGAALSGPGVVYALDVPEPSLLRARVDRVYGEEVNVDLQILTGDDPAQCLTGHDLQVHHVVPAGPLRIVVDTQGEPGQAPLTGPYTLDVSLEPPPGPCEVEEHDLLMLWWRCSETLACRTDTWTGLDWPVLEMPAEGPVVAEAHLVTTAESFPDGWPRSGRDRILRHYEVTAKASGYDMRRRGPWAPAGEGLNVSRYGEGSMVERPPPALEPWYMNMFWAFPAPPGTRMIIRNKSNGRAVVAVAGYEKGPGSSTAVGGVSEEILHHLRSRHRGRLHIGLATDQTLPFGPITCAPPQRVE